MASARRRTGHLLPPLTPQITAGSRYAAGSQSASASIAVTTGVLVLVAASAYNGTNETLSITDTLGNLSWTQISVYNSTSHTNTAIFYAYATSTTSGSMTVTMSSGSGAVIIQPYIVTNQGGVYPNGNGTLAAPPATTSMVFSVAADSTSGSAPIFTPPIGYQSLLSTQNYNTTYFAVAAQLGGASQSVSWSETNANSPAIASIEVQAQSLSQYAAAVQALHPQYWWTFADSASPAKDVTGNTNSATATNATFGQTSVPPAIPGTSVSMSAGYFTTTNANTINNSLSFTILGWFKTTTTNSGLAIIQSSKTGLATNWQPSIYVNSSGYLGSSYYNAGSSTISFAGTTVCADGNWHMFALSGSPSSGLTLYLDGSVQGTSGTWSQQSFTGYWWLGIYRDGGGNNHYFTGNLSNFSIWNSVLTSTQISNLYTLGVA